jgi:type II secretory pathway pseudopilin PulG
MPAARVGGFTLLEVMVASLLLMAGIGALLGTAGLTIRLVVRGRQSTRVVAAATAQIETLRGLAAAAPLYCGGLGDGADSSSDGTTWSWRIDPAGAVRMVSVIVAVPVPGGRATDTLSAVLWCPP